MISRKLKHSQLKYFQAVVLLASISFMRSFSVLPLSSPHCLDLPYFIISLGLWHTYSVFHFSLTIFSSQISSPFYYLTSRTMYYYKDFHHHAYPTKLFSSLPFLYPSNTDNILILQGLVPLKWVANSEPLYIGDFHGYHCKCKSTHELFVL